MARFTTGMFIDLRARGGYTVSVRWSEGSVAIAESAADWVGNVVVRSGADLPSVTNADGQAISFELYRKALPRQRAKHDLEMMVVLGVIRYIMELPPVIFRL